MKLPSNYSSEDQFVKDINEVIRPLAFKFKFGVHDEEDMFQYGWFEVLKALDEGKYDESRPLQPFVRTVCRTRFLNLIRKEVRRTDSPCKECAAGTYCTEFGPCEIYLTWQKRNQDKAALSSPLLFGEEDEDPPTICDACLEATIDEIQEIIDEQLSPQLRKSLLMMRDGELPSRARREELSEFMEGIFDG